MKRTDVVPQSREPTNSPCLSSAMAGAECSSLSDEEEMVVVREEKVTPIAAAVGVLLVEWD